MDSTLDEFGDSPDSDSVITESTVEPDDLQEFEVEEILAERYFKGVKQYLIKWLGYTVPESNWEPEDHLNSKDEILHDWNEKKMKISRQIIPPFDIDHWEAQRSAFKLEKHHRKMKRRDKRLQLGLKVHAESDYDYLIEHDEDSDGEQVGIVGGLDNEGCIVISPDEHSDDENDSLFDPTDSDSLAEVADVEGDGTNPTTSEQDTDNEDSPLKPKGKRKRSHEQSLIEVSGTATAKRSRPSLSDADAVHIKAAVSSFQNDELAKASSMHRSTHAAFVKLKIGNGKSSQRSAPPHLQLKGRGSVPSSAKNSGTSTNSQPRITGFETSKPLQNMNTAPAREPHKGKDIFRNWDTQVPSRRLKGPDALLNPQSTDTQFATLRTRNLHANKLSKREPPPNLEDVRIQPLSSLQLTEPSTEVPPIVPKPELPLQRTTTESTADSIHVRKPLASGNPTSNVVDPHDHVSHGLEQDTRKTCWFWANETCKFSDTQCEYKHGRSESGVAPERNILPKPGLTCYYWFHATCRFSDEECRFKHYHTGLVGDRYGGPPEVVDLSKPRRAEPEYYNGDKFPETCHYWFRETCFRSDEDCNYLHYNTGKIANPRGGPPELVDPSLLPRSKVLNIAEACFFWFQYGKCAKGESCRYTHRWTGVVRPPPRGHNMTGPLRKTPFWSKENPARKSHDADTFDADDGHVDTTVLSPESGSLQMPSTAIAEAGTALPFEESSLALIRSTTADSPIAWTDIESSTPIPFNNVPFNFRMDFDIGDGNKATFMLTVQYLGKAFVGSAVPESMQVTALCVSESMKTFINSSALKNFPRGEIKASDGFIAELEKLKQSLVSHVSGGLIFHNGSVLLIYPVAHEHWLFMGSIYPRDPSSQLFLSIIPGQAFVNMQCRLSQAETRLSNPVSSPFKIARYTLRLDLKTILLSPNVKRSFTSPTIFLMFPAICVEEIDYLTEHFRALASTVKIYNATEHGSWKYFCEKHNSGSILIHPSIYKYWDIPGLRTKQDGLFNFFQVGYGIPPQITPELTPAPEQSPSWHVTRLFPHGRTILITDELLMHHPTQSLHLIRGIVSGIRNSPFRHICLVGRPYLLSWLRDLATKKEQDQTLFVTDDTAASTSTNTHLQICTLIQSLLFLRDDYTDRFAADPHSTPSALAPVATPLEGEIDAYADLWQKNEQGALDVMVEWYAAWACSKVAQYRKFYVVTLAEAEVRERWRGRWRHLDVLSPDAYMERVGRHTNGE